ncbi:MAG: 1-deoxy-D-xylulose-5-phosphate reductoisomerase [Crocinitomicaceae bacterium]|nr:1-deoxy-D-xylulose-5-phosphate reductoisomerase [Crocinitomicaceae bacterium]
MKRIAILGSTGSIGTQALEVIAAHPCDFSLEVLTANENADLLIKQALQFKPNSVVIGDEKKYISVKEVLWNEGIKVFAGKQALNQIVESTEIDTVLTAVVGAAGLEPTLNAIKSKKNIALANKETLVVAGALITETARKNGVNIYPVDSEHSAIFQCLSGEWHNPIEKIYLTASGGPFRGKMREDIISVTPQQALKHPNWGMGQKITIDSATMMNKGLEVIEAHWLFNLNPKQIEVIIHPQSIIHSIVQFEDGSMKAQMGLPDMKLPIQYALSYPKRLHSDFLRFDFLNYPKLTFELPDKETFRALHLAYVALEKEGNIPCAMNAANEVAVSLFLEGRISFLEITEVVEECMSNTLHIPTPTLDELIQTDIESREKAISIIQR